MVTRKATTPSLSKGFPKKGTASTVAYYFNLFRQNLQEGLKKTSRFTPMQSRAELHKKLSEDEDKMYSQQGIPIE